MVSIIQRLRYRDDLLDNQKIQVFCYFITGQDIPENLDFPVEVDNFFYTFVKFFQSSNKEGFQKNYTELSRRRPSSDSPYVYDDYLAFIIVACLLKFDLDGRWMFEVLDIRKCSNLECQQLTTTFKNILRKNFNDKDNNRSVIITMQYLLNMEVLQETEIKAEFLFISNGKLPIYKSDILNLVSYRAFDIIIVKANILENEHVSYLRNFEKRFLKRVKIMATWIYYIFCIALILSGGYAYFKNPTVKEMFGSVDVIFAVFTVFGMGGIVAELISKKKITKYLVSKIENFFGYSQKSIV